MMGFDRGDIVLVNSNPAKGGEMGKLRLAVVMSTQDEIEMLSTIIVIPLSTVVEKESFPYRVFVPKRENLKNDSDACIYEIRALSKLRLKQKVAKLSDNEIKNFQNALCAILA